VIWKPATPCGVVGPVTVTDELVLVGCGKSWWGFAVMESQYGLGGAVVALDRKTGKVVWKVETPDTVGAAIAVGDGKAFCPVGGHGRYSMTRKPKGELLALDLKDGKKLWSCQVSGGSPVLAAPALAGRRVYAVAGDGTLAVIDAAYGRIIEKHQLNAGGEAGPDGMSVSSPTISGGRLYVGSETGGLRCFAGSAPGAGR
jgi:outer membrane protein assembly factor BamB